MPVSSAEPPLTRFKASRMHTPMTYDKFRPKFPLDPFAAVDQACNNPPSARAPWTLDVDTLPLPSILQHEQRVILIIGQPLAASLAPLFASAHLASSLLIIATHRPPALPFETYPSVYTLRLRSPLAIADAGATRLIGVLEWALQVAKLWRTSGGPKKQELMEEVSPGSQSVPIGQTFGRVRYSAMPMSQQDYLPSSAFSPAASMTSLTPSTKRRSRAFSLFRRKSSLSLVQDPANARPFDALLHFVPADAPDKAQLKAMILVTTLTRPYLAVPPARARSMRFYSDSNMRSSKPGKRWSFFRSSSNVASLSNSSATFNASNQSKSTLNLTEGSRTKRSSLSSLALLRARRSRLLHLMPSAPAAIKASMSGSSRFPTSNPSSTQNQAHLIRSIEAFLLSFCFSVSPELPAPIAGFASTDGDCAKARPYVLPAMALGDVLQIETDDDDEEVEVEGEEKNAGKKRSSEWTLAELLLSGALESQAEAVLLNGILRSGNDMNLGVSEGDKGKERAVDEKADVANSDWTECRAWIGSVREIVFVNDASSKRLEEAQIIPLRSSSQPLLPSEANPRSNPLPSQASSRPRTRSFQSRPVVTSNTGHPQMRQSQDQSYAARQNGSDPTTNARSTLFVDTKRRAKMSGFRSLAIEKRLPTPPEDENEYLEGMEVSEVSSTVSNATSCTRSHVDENDRAEGALAEIGGTDDFRREEVAYRRSSEKTGSKGHHQRHESYPRPSQSSSQSYDQTLSSHSPVPPSSASTARAGSSRHYSSRYQDQYATEQPSRRQDACKAEAEARYGRYDATDPRQQQYIADGSLPTPPDSESASSEGVSSDVAQTSSASTARFRDREVLPDGYAPSARSERDRGTEGSKRDGVKGAQRYEGEKARERVRERERRRRTHSQTSRPEPAPAVDDRTPPRRAKTKPEERHTSRERDPSERHISDVGALLKKPLRPDLRNPASSSGEGERSGSRQARLERKPSRPEMTRSKSSPDERERRTGGTSASSGVKRVPVPPMADVLPALPRESRKSRSRTAQTSSQPSNRSGGASSSSSRIRGSGTATTAAATAGLSPSERGGKERGPAKWKFWKEGARSVL